MTSFTPEVTTTNRRRFIRVPARCSVSSQRILFFARGDSAAWGEAKNIGAGGILFTCDRDRRKNDLLKVSLALPTRRSTHSHVPGFEDEAENQTAVTAVCQVLRSRKLPDGKYEVAVKFVNILQDEMAGLKRFIAAEAERLGVVG